MPRAKNITSTITSTQVTALIADVESMTLKEQVITIQGEHTEQGDIMKSLNKAGYQVVAVKDSTVTEQLYGMTEELFFMGASRLDSRTAGRGMITRTLRRTQVTALIADVESMTLKEQVITIQGEHTEQGDIMKALSKAGYQVVAVKDSTVTEQLYGMTVDTFTGLAEPMKNR